jgi:hypothetical protein
MATYDVRFSLQMFCVKRVGVVANMNDIGPCNNRFERGRKNSEFVDVSQPFAHTLSGGAQPANNALRTQGSHLMASLNQTILHKRRKTLHAFLGIIQVIADEQNSHASTILRGMNRLSHLAATHSTARTKGNENEAINPDAVDSTTLC